MNKRQNYLPKGWLQLRLGDLGALTGGGTPSRSVKRYYAGNIPWVTVKDLKEGEFWISDATEHITPEAIENSATNLIDPGSVIIATRVGLGKMAINQVPVAINQDLKAMRPNGKVLPEFLLFLVYKSTFDILRYSVGTTVKGIRQKDLLNIPVVLPPLPVQERFLAFLDRLTPEQEDPGARYSVAVNVEVRFIRSKAASAASVRVTNDPNAPAIRLSENDIRERYPWDYRELTEQCRKRYSHFKVDKEYHKLRKALEGDKHFALERRLDPEKPRPKKMFYAPAILEQFDKHYRRRQ